MMYVQNPLHEFDITTHILNAAISYSNDIQNERPNIPHIIAEVKKSAVMKT